MQIDQNILIRYFLGQASEVEKEYIHQWIEKDEGNRAQFIRERIRFDATILADSPVISRSNRRLRVPYIIGWLVKGVAAVILLLISFQLYDGYRVKRLSQTYQVVTVPAGNRTHLLLPDGTSVWLNANTSLRYPLAFSEEVREIYLDGEAYFEVAKGKNPFIVRTGKYDVEVLGTVFDVEAYSARSHFRTSLYEGRVKLYSDCHPKAVFLLPGETAELVGDELQVSLTEDRNSFRWKDGLIYIEDESFVKIMELFEKFYDIRIVVNNKFVGNLGYRGKLRISDGIDHALRVLQRDFPFEYERDEESNIIYIN